MRWWRSIGNWRPWPSRQRREEDIDRELRTHLELETEEQQQSGLPADEARYAAQRAFATGASWTHAPCGDGVGSRQSSRTSDSHF